MSQSYSISGTCCSESRVLFSPLTVVNDRDPETKKYGVRSHSWLCALWRTILYRLGLSKGIVTAKIDGTTLYLNRGSFTRWCKRYGSDFTAQDDAVTKIKEIISNILQQQKKEREEHKEKLRKINDIALVHLEKLNTLSYNADGEITTELLKGHGLFGSVFKDKSTIWPANSLESRIKTYTLTHELFYHGTLPEAAKAICSTGFDPMAPTETGTECGAGSYLTIDKEKAFGYANGNTAGLLACRLKANLKIAPLDSDMKSDVFDLLRAVCSVYARKEAQAIETDFKILATFGRLTTSNVTERLFDLFVRDFFMRRGFAGFYTEYSRLAGCSYLNLFDPKRDIAHIEIGNS